MPDSTVHMDQSSTLPPCARDSPGQEPSRLLGLHNLLGDDNCVQRRAAQELVARDEELDAVLAEDKALADAPDLHVVLTSGVQGHGVLQVGGVIHHLHTHRALQQLPGLLRGARQLGLDGDGLGVRAERRHAHGRAGDLHVIRQAEDLLQLPSHLHLLLGVAVRLEHVDLRDHVEGQLVREELRLRARAGLRILDQAGLEL
eukprot:CAMPEP_0195061418 /NCGR_PEP_ID=MMETSP0448-20130528/8355_1 /TAXON_ID=66468 /ORGANISM="Heterocapsa triquestra, Strain CCMP 448" /LENGTH=200 /DNA_ID=CAMNT_0040091979 /DNA_START=305 /DNA_END=903 /DNA_ORIENTATION=+